MPITPYHFGPGALAHVCAPRAVSFLAFCAANVLIDLESLYHLLLQRWPVHAFWHTALGAIVVWVAVLLAYLGVCAFHRRWPLPNVLGWQQLTPTAVGLGAALGAYSHVALDAIMHGDVRPFAPWSEANPLLGALSLPALHSACAVAAVLAGVGLWLRRHRAR